MEEITSEHNDALADSLSEFVKWVEITGSLNRGSSWYYEAMSLLENAVARGRVSAFKELGIDCAKEEALINRHFEEQE